MRKCAVAAAASLVFAVTLSGASGQESATARPKYMKAPDTIRQMLDTPPPATAVVSPSREHLLLVDSLRQPPISDLSAPMLRLAGLRINPENNGPHHPPRRMGLSLVSIANGREQKLAVPANALLGTPRWSPDGKLFAFINTTAKGIELWIGEAATGKLRRISAVQLNGLSPLEQHFRRGSGATGPAPIAWLPDSRTLLVHAVIKDRGTPPAVPAIPEGPVIQENLGGKPAPVRTYEDLLESPYDEDLFDYYATAQLAFVDVQSGKVTPIGKPGLFSMTEASPDGQHLLVARLHRPYSYLSPAEAFPRLVEVWDRSGKVEYKLADLPLAEHVPIEGVPTGPRDYDWRPTAPATLVWAEALDEGNPKNKVPHRDRLMMLSAPFTAGATEFTRTEHRFTNIIWGEKDLAFVHQFDRDRRWGRTFMWHVDDPGFAPKLVWDRSIRDRYKDPGTPLWRTLPNGQRVVWEHGDSIFLAGEGASDQGDRPFLDRLDLKTLATERLFRAADGSYEQTIALLADDGTRFLTRYESPTEPSNYYLRTVQGTGKTALTHYPDPAAQLRGVKKEIVRYQRGDGVQLSFTLYLPPECGSEAPGVVCRKPGERLPTIVWAYPLEFSDAGTAGQVSGSQYRFTSPTGISHLFLVTQGYAILDNATMPVIGDPDTMNNTYVEQIVAGAKAAIDKAVEMGVTDRNRVGVGGHSYGAFMTANLLAHCDLFKAGVARSGAYNRTLTPFGFQSERRTLWEAPEMYMKVSPFMVANKIKTPILLIHGMADDNSGTFPIQSERMYHAIKGNGGIVRYVQLPYEPHGYQGRESVEHTLWEMIHWFDTYVKNVPAAGEKAAGK
jgi:dipeptidyl aminopeptidase/acylaminoacyl peptidase